MDGPRDAAIIVTAVVGELAGIFGPLHVETRGEVADLRSTVTELRGTVADLVGIVAEMSRRLAEIERPAGLVYQVGEAMEAENRARGLPPTFPTLGTRRPKEVDQACAVDPAEGAQRVHLDKYGLTLYPKPNADPKTVWDNVLRAIDAERGSRGTARRQRRARGV